MSLYVYGLLEERFDHSDISGVGPGNVRIEPVCGFFAIVSEFTGTKLETSRENILAHERVLDAVLTHTTPLPFRFGTIVSPPQLHEFVAEHAKTLAADFERVRGCVQMSVKLIAKSTDPSAAAASDEGPGSRFLRQKQAGRNVLLSAARDLNGAMSDLLRAAEVTTHTTPRPMASVAHLIEKSKLAEYRDRIRAASVLRTDLASIHSGPWPPYGFVSAGLAMAPAIKA